jgi:hypothetical protein
MGIELPGELADLLNELGYIWPKADEQKLFALGQHWMGFASTLQGLHEDAGAAAQPVWSDNTAAGVDAFQQAWGQDTAGHAVLGRGQAGAQVIGGGLMVCAAAVLALKINVIVQLSLLVIEIIEAIATSEVTFGASLLEVPVFKKLTDMAINFLINQAMEVVLG